MDRKISEDVGRAVKVGLTVFDGDGSENRLRRTRHPLMTSRVTLQPGAEQILSNS